MKIWVSFIKYELKIAGKKTDGATTVVSDGKQRIA